MFGENRNDRELFMRLVRLYERTRTALVKGTGSKLIESKKSTESKRVSKTHREQMHRQ